MDDLNQLIITHLIPLKYAIMMQQDISTRNQFETNFTKVDEVERSFESSLSSLSLSIFHLDMLDAEKQDSIAKIYNKLLGE